MAALLRRSPRALCQCQRPFSTTTSRAVSLQWDKNDSEALAEALPEYPYGPARWYKQSNRGLYGGQRLQFGNNVGERSEVKTRRSWHPNVFTKKLFSRALNRHVQVKVSARVLRTIDKLGGLDEYLLGEKAARIKELGESGWWLRWAIMQTPAIKKRFVEERKQLGLPEDPELAATEELNAMEPIEEVEQAGEDGEAVPMDDAFQIEHDPDLPPIKFRVGPGKHVMLTESGWIRTRADPSRWVEQKKDRIRETHFSKYVELRIDTFIERLKKQQSAAAVAGEELLSEEEEKQLIKAARKEITAEREAKVDERYNLLLEQAMSKKMRRRAEKKRKADARAGIEPENMAEALGADSVKTDSDK